MFNPTQLTKLIDRKNPNRTEILFEFRKAGIKISRPTLDNHESGKTEPRPSLISQWAKFFGVKEQFFFNQ